MSGGQNRSPSFLQTKQRTERKTVDNVNRTDDPISSGGWSGGCTLKQSHPIWANCKTFCHARVLLSGIHDFRRLQSGLWTLNFVFLPEASREWPSREFCNWLHFTWIISCLRGTTFTARSAAQNSPPAHLWCSRQKYKNRHSVLDTESRST